MPGLLNDLAGVQVAAFRIRSWIGGIMDSFELIITGLFFDRNG
ncbi:hypothetical protein [Prevotella sp.]|jgi:hypothetical protein|nr:hypothetical protein [Prevotella sp.]